MTTRVGLTCAQVPLAWPASVSLDAVTPCSTCGIKISSETPGTLQLSSRQARDGITVAEAVNTAADYQGQRYSIDECVFHTPGLHVFPGQTDVYPAEYHIYMTSVAQPVRTIAIVIPVSHRDPDNGDPAGASYFAAATAQGNQGQTNPSLQTLLVPGTPVLQYLGVDLRSCAADPDTAEIQYLLPLRVMSVRAADLERIPREGTGSTLPDALPLPGPMPSQAVASDVLLKSTLLAKPGILNSTPILRASTGTPTTLVDNYTCKPLQVIDGKDVIQTDVSGIPLIKVLAGSNTDVSGGGVATGGTNLWMYAAISFVSTMAGLLFADMLFGYVWTWFFKSSTRLDEWIALKVWIFVGIALGSMFWPTATRDGLYGLMNLVFPAS
jgi:hypothetical protein